ncbi:MAG: hypothetical protein Q9195_000054 [Heterodermia aff. obscurata]
MPLSLLEPSTFPCLPALALASNATVVCIHYRLSTEQSYPTPVHDVLAGFDWVQKHLARVNVQIDHAEHPVETANIGVCGELVSGSLATMLALTECRPTKGGVKAAALGNAIVDWTSLFPAYDNGIPPAASYREATTSTNAGPVAPEWPSGQYGPSLSNEGLLHLRSRLFTRPEKYFDPFASPLLFFRTPGCDLASPVDDMHVGQAFDGPSAGDSTAAHDASLAETKKRPSRRKYPPAGSGLRLPYMRFEVGVESILREQGEEMVDVLNKSAKHWEDELYGAGDGGGVSKRVRLLERSGLGLWGENELRELGSWFGDVLRK